jgi:AAA domain/R3H domain
MEHAVVVVGMSGGSNHSDRAEEEEDLERLVTHFCQQQRQWLALEYHASSEDPTEAQRSLRVAEVSVGLFGRAVLRFVPHHRTGFPGAHSSFSTGDEVEVDWNDTPRRSSGGTETNDTGPRKRRNRPRGVICAVTDMAISVALSSEAEIADWDAPPYTLRPRSRGEIQEKLQKALQQLEEAVSGTQKDTCCPAQHIIPHLFQVPKPVEKRHLDRTRQTEVSPCTTAATSCNIRNTLDPSQREAVEFALDPPYPICCIHGPPGTGKTTTVVEWIHRACLDRGWKLLVTAPSHVAVDQLLARLTGSSLRLVRLGHPARVQPQLLAYSLEALVRAADGTAIVQDIRQELQQHWRSSTTTRVNYAQVQRLRREIRQREEKVVQQLLAQAQVVLCTCVGAASRLLAGRAFDAVVIDEAAQATEAACWIPALRAQRLILLAGDHCQLPPTVRSEVPEVQQGLATTLFERILHLYGASPVESRISRMLKVQYRMHATIANWASQAMYHQALQTHESVRDRTLAHSFPAALEDDDDFLGPLVLLDTAGCDLHDCTNADGSRYNPGEAQLVGVQVRRLLALGLRADQMAVITPYNGQVELLKSMLLPEHPTLPIRSVDGFQGGERDAVILSLVRSSPGGRDGIGFLRDDRRLNVAVTRAQRHCCVIGDSDTVGQSRFLRNLLDWIETHGEVHSAMEILADNDVNEKDMEQAERILQQLMDQTDLPHGTSFKPPSVSKRPSTATPKSEVDLDERRATLRARIQEFHDNSPSGAEMRFGTELSKLDRRLVHEIAEELGLEHASGGREGVNRRIAVSIPVRSDTAHSKVLAMISTRDSVVESPVAAVDTIGRTIEDDAVNVVADDEDDDEEPVADVRSASHSFAALNVGDEVESNHDSRNDLLRILANERAQREKHKPASKSKIKNKGQKLGGASRPTHPASIAPAVDVDSDDEMAYLDAQIASVQNSHGRRVEGAGPGYRTIINGILLAQPKPARKTTNTKATNALNAKLKAAQDSRKVQLKKK